MYKTYFYRTFEQGYKEAYMLNPPASSKGKRLKIMYVTQTGIQPPHIVIFANNADLMKDHYKRYVENKLREAFGFFGTPIRLSVRERSDKDKNNHKKRIFIILFLIYYNLLTKHKTSSNKFLIGTETSKARIF